MSVVSVEQSRYSWCDDLTVSRLHLRIHCILYEQDPISNVAPLVYATDLSANGTYLRKSDSKYAASHDVGVLMGHKNTFLLDDGDELRLSDTITLIYVSRGSMKPVEFTPIQEMERQLFASRYLLTDRMLGEGGYGKVLVGINQQTQQQLACKIVQMDKIAAEVSRTPANELKQHVGPSKGRCFREFNILKDLSHPNIVAIEKVFCSRESIYIFQELVTGGDLFSFLEFNGGRLGSMQAAVIVRQILKGIQHLHNQDIVHRDLKPDNILMSSLEDGARVVITDFGSARHLPRRSSQPDKCQRMFSCVGTLEYTAPEIHKANRTIPAEQGYSKSVDMWSVGSLTATVLTGDNLFTNRAHSEYELNPQGVIVGLAAICDLSVLDDEYNPLWNLIGFRPKDFVRGLLVLEEERRMTATEALAHHWFTSYAEDFEELYARSVADWVPPTNNVQLVEEIGGLLPSSAITGLSDSIWNQETTSRHFTPREPRTFGSMVYQNSVSQCLRAESEPLSLVAADTAHFVSQVQPSSHGFKDNSSEHQYSQQSFDAADNDDFAPLAYGKFPPTSAKLSRGHGKPLVLDVTPLETYNNSASSRSSIDSEESLNDVTNHYSQQGYFIHLTPPPDSQLESESIQVSETPTEEQVYRTPRRVRGQDSDEADHKSQFQGDYLQQEATDEEQDAILVHETPPEFLWTRARWSDQQLPTYRVKR
ncbi:Pkinase-domain-containing protein [Stemphylium lycopersici]|uniref:Pkinase-domain-containing protein n=1 Tax=Stemphylium lycopersici TaxID=183478 RepID=A0A364NAN0_STELY|nr:Pkinase-domain-containing protein [Stemphylium lycopersici]